MQVSLARVSLLKEDLRKFGLGKILSGAPELAGAPLFLSPIATREFEDFLS